MFNTTASSVSRGLRDFTDTIFLHGCRFNSSVFESRPIRTYEVYAVGGEFPINYDYLARRGSSDGDDSPVDPPHEIRADILRTMQEKALNKTLKYYEPGDCICKYASVIQPSNFPRNLLIVAIGQSYNESVLDFGGQETLYADDRNAKFPSWLRARNELEAPATHFCTLSEDLRSQYKWDIYANNHHYSTFGCLVEEAVTECQLTLTLGIMIVVIMANFFKIVVMTLTYLTLNTPTLVTVGDAIASFLDRPDSSTLGLCTITRADFQNPGNQNARAIFRSSKLRSNRMPWSRKRHFWFAAVSARRWLICTILSETLPHSLDLPTH